MRPRPRIPAALRLALLALLVSVLAVAGAKAHDLFDFDDWMQRIDDSSQNLQRHIAKRDVPAARDSARELEELYALMADFFEKREESADAVRWSHEGRDWARLAQLDLAAGRFVSARKHALAIAHGCRDCHFQYKPL